MNNLKEDINYIILGLSPFIVFYIYYVITTELTPANYPPRIAKCPDYWVYNKNVNGCFGSAYPDYDGDINNDFNINVGTISDNDINEFSGRENNRYYINFDDMYPSLCEKYNWTQKYSISWSGISTLDKNICIDTSPNVELDTPKDLLDDFRKYNGWQ